MASKTKTNFRLQSIDDVAHIPDLITAIKIMKELGIPENGIKTTKDAKKKIAEVWISKQDEIDTIMHRKERDAVREALVEDKANREELLKIYGKMDAFFNELPKKFLDDLQEVFPNFQATLKEKSQELKKSDCAILVAGETGAGKSSLINLLLGINLLPTSNLQCTSTVCELRNCKDRYAIVYHNEKRKQPKIVECKDEAGQEGFLQKLVPYITEVDAETDESPYRRIEIYWPIPMLQEGVVFVDSPGVGQDKQLPKRMEKYFDNAFGFIYVINTGNAGGIHKDRLGQLLRLAVQQTDFDPSTAIFVSNKWDQVSQAESEKVMAYVIDRLRNCFPGVKKSQVFPISTKQAAHVVDCGSIMKEHSNLVEGIRHVLPLTFRSKLLSYYGWLSSLLKRALYSLKVSKMMDVKSVEDKEKTFEVIHHQIRALEQRAEDRIYTMRQDVKRAVDEIAKTVFLVLAMTEYQDMLLKWNEIACPKPESFKTLARNAASRIADRVSNVIDLWDRENNIVGGVKTKILKKFKSEFELFEDQVKQIEGVFLGEDVKVIADLQKSMRLRTPVRTVWKKAKKTTGREDGFLSIGSAIGTVCAQTLDPKNRTLRAIFKSYDSPKASHAMKAATELCLSELREKDVSNSLEKYFERFSKNINQIGKMIPEFLRADRHLIRTLSEEVQQKEDRLYELYPRLITTCEHLQGNLDMYFARRLMKFDFNFSDFKLDPNETPIGKGSFANVYSSSLQTPEGKLSVALKVCRDYLAENNVSDVLLEDRILRDLRHKYVVQYFGACRRMSGRDMQWVMVLEFCPTTLKDHFIGSEANSPAKHHDIYALQIEAMREVAQFAEQICSGLQYLHEKGLAHRDMKPENILLTENNIVKLTDVGLAKRVIDISGTIAGSPVYMAPEILLQKGQYDMKADIYSLAIILWEMWYGIDAADHIRGQLFMTFEEAIKRGLRPSMTLNKKPPEDWLKLITSAWDKDPSVRPKSQDIKMFFHRFLEQSA